MKEYKKSSQDRWRGKRYISQVRQSNDSEGTTSTQAQLKWMHAEGDRLGMIHVDDIVLNGLTGSLPAKRTDLEMLLKRKRECNDFDILLIQKCDRLTRSGSDHAGWFHHEAAKAGIEIMYPGDNLPEDGGFNGMIRAAMFDAAREQAKSIGQRSVQGNMYGINRGRNCVISRTPFGCDRLYFNAQKDPLFIIRNLGDGRQQKLDPKTRRVIDTYGQAGKGTKGHYRKQRDEGVLIVPGADDRVEVVRLIFDQHYSHNWGGKRIANLLNRRGILSPTGIGWSQRQVESLYENPVFCGWALGRRVAQGIYFCQGDDQPIPVEHDPAVLANCHTLPKQLRPPEDWVWQEQILMLDYLPKALAEKALPLIKQLFIERWERSQDPTRPTRSKSKHKGSEYILTGILFAKQDGASLTGILCGKVGNKRRYYRHRKGRLGYKKGNIFNKMIPAQALEQSIFELIGTVIADTPDIRQRIIEATARESSSTPNETQLADLRQRRTDVSERVRLIVKTLDRESLADAKPELDRLSDQRRELETQIAQAEQALAHTHEDPEALADQAVARLTSLNLDWTSLSPAARRELIQQFVERIEIDMETKEAEVSLRLPPWALANGDTAMRLANGSPPQTGCETHPLVGTPLAYADCLHVHDRKRRTVCYRCRRRAA